MEQIIQHGKVIRGWLGVEAQSVTPEIAKAFGIHEGRGALVAEVEPGSPAPKSGIKQGDIIVDVNGTAVEDSRQLSLKVS
jgi:S1-C subfamily serine protease